MRKSAALLLVLVFLAASCMIVAKPVKAQYQGNISIGADGSVSPSTAPIERLGASYILTSDVAGNIAVKTNNIVFDGNGHVISGGYIGIDLSSLSNVTITNTTITGSALGIAVRNASSNIISGNSFVDNNVGISLSSYWENGKCSHNVIVGNNFTGCSKVFWMYDGSRNTIYHNNFIKNAVILDDAGYLEHLGSINIWDDGHGLGNYWSDYLTRYPNATEIDNSGIGDTSYFVRPTDYIDTSSVAMSIEAREFWTKLNAAYAANTDRYPLMKPFTTTPPKISVLSPLNQTYNETSIPSVFTVDKPVNWTGYSFDGEPNVTVTSSSLLTNVTIANVTNGVHNVTVYANDTYGNMGASETVTFTVAVPEPFPTVPVAAASVAVVAAVITGLLLYFKKRKKESGNKS